MAVLVKKAGLKKEKSLAERSGLRLYFVLFIIAVAAYLLNDQSFIDPIY